MQAAAFNPKNRADPSGGCPKQRTMLRALFLLQYSSIVFFSQWRRDLFELSEKLAIVRGNQKFSEKYQRKEIKGHKGMYWEQKEFFADEARIFCTIERESGRKRDSQWNG